MHDPRKPRDGPVATSTPPPRPSAPAATRVIEPVRGPVEMRRRAAQMIAIAVGRRIRPAAAPGTGAARAAVDRDIDPASISPPPRAARGDDDLMSAPQDPAPQRVGLPEGGMGMDTVAHAPDGVDATLRAPVAPSRGKRFGPRVFRVF